LWQGAAGCCKVLLGGAVCLNVINVCVSTSLMCVSQRHSCVCDMSDSVGGAVRCGVVQCVSTCVAVCCCSVLLQCVIAHGAEWCSMSQCHQCVCDMIMTQSVLRFVAGWCSVSQPVLQYVVAHGAEWCSVSTVLDVCVTVTRPHFRCVCDMTHPCVRDMTHKWNTCLIRDTHAGATNVVQELSKVTAIYYCNILLPHSHNTLVSQMTHMTHT